MNKSKPKQSSPFSGSWRIISMSCWDQDYVNAEVDAYIEFDPPSRGRFHFGYVQGEVDSRMTTRDGKPAAEFSWDGVDGADSTPLTGRGWAVLQDDQLYGMFFIHHGDDSEFVAKKAAGKRAGKKR